MTATGTSAEVHPAPRGAHDALVLAATALGGVLAVVVWVVLLYADALDAGARRGDGGTPLAYWSQFLLIPLVALAGGRFAPGRVRAVVVAACAGQVLFVLAMRLGFLLEHGWFALEVVVAEAVLIGLAVGAARLGSLAGRRRTR